MTLRGIHDGYAPWSNYKGDRGGRRWIVDAKCVGHDPDLWDVDASPDPVTAERICASCPVKAQCYAEAVRDQASGVIRAGVAFGVSTRKERSLARRRESYWRNIDRERAQYRARNRVEDKEAKRIRDAEYRESHKEQIRAAGRRRYLAKRDEILEKQRQYKDLRRSALLSAQRPVDAA